MTAQARLANTGRPVSMAFKITLACVSLDSPAATAKLRSTSARIITPANTEFALIASTDTFAHAILVGWGKYVMRTPVNVNVW